MGNPVDRDFAEAGGFQRGWALLHWRYPDPAFSGSSLRLGLSSLGESCSSWSGLKGMRMEVVEAPRDAESCQVIFWTDALATEEQAWIGGWLQESSNTEECRWFSMDYGELGTMVEMSWK